MAQTKSGAPLRVRPFLSTAPRAELKAQNVYTLESLADIEGAELKNLGPGGARVEETGDGADCPRARRGKRRICS